MAPAAISKGGADGGDKPNAKQGASAKSSTKMSQLKSTKRGPKELSQAANRKQNSAVRKAKAPRRRMSKKKQKEVSQAYQRLLKTRKIFGPNRSGGEGLEDSSTDDEQSDNLQEYIDSKDGVEDDLARSEQRLISTALKRCGEWVDPRSPIEGRYILRDIETPLTPIQFATLGWMLGREAPSTSGRGGIVAHDMGMGKTLMALAVMVTNRTGLERRKANDCATLVVVPSYAVIDHWEEECERHAPTVFLEESVARYRDLKPIKRVDWLKPYKIVFATYSELAREVPDWYREPTSPEKPLDPDLESKIKNHTWRPIFQAMWYRVVLDEAHTIKNRTAKSSLAIRRLQKRCAWAISGTIVSNSREEMFPYFNFLGMEFSKYSAEFNQVYFPDKVANVEYQEILTRVMMGRKIGENFLGETIIALPRHHASTEELQPSANEMVILNFIKEKIRETAEKSIMKSIDASEDNGTMISKAWYSITSLLHLYRFAGIHPFLVEKAYMREFTSKDNERLIQELKDLEDNAEDNSAKDNKTDAADVLSIEKILGIALQHRKLGGIRCCACNKKCVEKEEDIFKLPCGHHVCWACLSKKKMLKRDFTLTCRAKGCSKESKWADTEFCPTLYQPISPMDKDGSQTDSDREDTESESEDDWRKRRRARKKPKKPQKPRVLGPGCDLHGNEPLLDPDKGRFLACADRFLKRTRMVIPSAKIVRVQELLMEWHQTAPDDKIIIFTQFMVVASLVGRIARLEGIDFLYYTGDLSEVARARALAKFKTDDSAKVLITSLMCGSQALNITCANRVILMELWWNSPAEEQAFSRVYRMGQEKEVHVVRLQCKGTREDEIMEMQHMKEKDIRSCLMSKKMAKLDHTKHTIFSLMGFPIMENGKVVGLKRPRGSYLSDTSDESDGDEQNEDAKERWEELPDTEELQGQDEKGGEEEYDEAGGEEGDEMDQGKTAGKEEAGKDCKIEVDNEQNYRKDCDIDVDKEDREKDGPKQEKVVKKKEDGEQKSRKECEVKVDEHEKVKNEEPEKRREEELTDKMDVDMDVGEDEKEGAETATGMAEETSRGDETDKMDLD